MQKLYFKESQEKAIDEVSEIEFYSYVSSFDYYCTFPQLFEKG